MGHFQSKCPKNKLRKGTAKKLEKAEKESNMVLMTVEGEARPRNNIWIANSAASMHITNSEASLYNVQDNCKLVKLMTANFSTQQRYASYK